MLTKKVKNRIIFLIVVIFIFIISIFFVLKSLNESILYFHTPTEINQKKNLSFDKKMRVGGMVKKKINIERLKRCKVCNYRSSK